METSLHLDSADNTEKTSIIPSQEGHNCTSLEFLIFLGKQEVAQEMRLEGR